MDTVNAAFTFVPCLLGVCVMVFPILPLLIPASVSVSLLALSFVLGQEIVNLLQASSVTCRACCIN